MGAEIAARQRGVRLRWPLAVFALTLACVALLMLAFGTWGYDLVPSRAFWEGLRLYWMPLTSLSAWIVLVVRGSLVGRARDASGRVAWIVAVLAFPPFAISGLLWFYGAHPDW